MKTWILIAIVVLYLFRDRLFPPALPASRPLPGMPPVRPLGYDYYSGPPPGPIYGSSPPTHAAWEAPVVAGINALGGALNTYLSNSGGDSSGSIDTSFVNDLPAY